MDWPGFRFPPLNVITPFHPESMGATIKAAQQGVALMSLVSGVVTANLAHYIPFRIFEPATAVKMSNFVGATQNGNVDLGIYDWEKNRLVNTGTVAMGAINTLQEHDITDTLLLPGRYFMAYQQSSGTGTIFQQVQNDEVLLPVYPHYEQAVGSFGLPATAGFALSTAATLQWIAMGVHFSTLI